MSEPPLMAIIRQRIAETGPITLADYMGLALGHPDHGYYVKARPIGREGDFVTAPEVSQMFGELIGAWALDLWQRSIAPAPLVLAEAGPGRGTLMADMIRTARLLPDAARSLTVHLVETSRTLRAEQERRLADLAPVTWHDNPATLPDAPMILIANEFLDALPIRQFVRKAGHWHEVMVTVAEDSLGFTTSPLPADPKLIPASLRDAPEGTVAEIAPAAERAVADIADRIARLDGAALFIDYGHAGHAVGDTFQAVSGHAFADPLARPGEVDLTAHVDFAAVAEAARTAGAATHGPVTQGAFLAALGLHQRATILKRNGAPGIEEAVHRLADRAEMGDLFKVLAITAPDADPPAGFAATETP